MIHLHLNRLMPHVAENSKRALLRRVARQMAVDLNWHPVGMEAALMPGLDGATHTPIGDGVLVIDSCLPGLEHPYFLIVTLKHAIDVHAADRQAVDVVAILLSPSDSRIGHIRTVSAVMRRLRDSNLAMLVRATDREEAARAALLGESYLGVRAA